MIFTVAVTYNGKTTTFAICSNYQQKDKYANGTFLKRLYDDYLEDDSEVVEIVWSDGPTSDLIQFNIQFNFNSYILSPPHTQCYSYNQ